MNDKKNNDNIKKHNVKVDYDNIKKYVKVKIDMPVIVDKNIKK